MSGTLALLLAGSGRLVAALLALLLGLLPRPEGGPLPDPSPTPIASFKPAEPGFASAAVDAMAFVPRAPPESGLAVSSFSPPSWPAPADGSLLVLTARGSAVLVLACGCGPEWLSRAGELVGQKCGGTEAGCNWYAYAGNDPVNNWDPTGLDYIKYQGNDVYWVIEQNGFWWNPDVREVKIGSTYNDGRLVHFDQRFGGGNVEKGQLEAFASKFWDEYPDISGQSVGTQDTILGRALDRIRGFGTCNIQGAESASGAFVGALSGPLGRLARMGNPITGPSEAMTVAGEIGGDYQAYRGMGVNVYASMSLAGGSRLPIAGGIISGTEMCLGESVRPGDFGESLDGWEYAERSIQVAGDVTAVAGMGVGLSLGLGRTGSAGFSMRQLRPIMQEARALELQGLDRNAAFNLMRKFRQGQNPGNEYVFHFTRTKGAAGILEDEFLRAGYGIAGRGVYAGTVAKPSWLLKHVPFLGWGLGNAPTRIPLLLKNYPRTPQYSPGIPPKTYFFETNTGIPLGPGG